MKYALIIGNNKYDDPKLRPLKTPAADSRALAKILRARRIGNFDEVSLLIDPAEAKARHAICAFLLNKKPDDLVLLYFSGHGVLDEWGNLFLASKDTRMEVLSGTALSSSFISYEMDKCRSRCQVLILDCCHSGAFARGGKGDQRAVTGSTFEGNGSGRVVLTASDSTQQAFEGDQVMEQSSLSLFTHFLLEGLKTGEADLNHDGKISLDEWYDYSHARITSITPQQIPHKWSYRQQGELIIARNPVVNKKKKTSVAEPIRAMLDQKHLEYRQHKLLIAPEELEIIRAEVQHPEIEFEDADKKLILLSSLVHGTGERWLKISGAKGLEWLRQACLDETCPAEARRGAAALLGKIEDDQTYAHLLDCVHKRGDPVKRDVWLSLLSHYLGHSDQRYALPWAVRGKVFPRLMRLALREGSVERARMSRIAGSIAPVCALIAFILSRTNDLATNIVGAVFVIFAAAILAIAFAQVVTSVIFMTRRWRLIVQLFFVGGIGSAFGALLFIFIANQTIVGLAGGLIALLQSMSYRGKVKLSAEYLSVLTGVVVFTFTVLVSHPPTLMAKIGYAFSASLFSFLYVYFGRKPNSVLHEN